MAKLATEEIGEAFLTGSRKMVGIRVGTELIGYIYADALKSLIETGKPADFTDIITLTEKAEEGVQTATCAY